MDRGINIAARDSEGSTARDYLTLHGGENVNRLRILLDDFIIEQVCNDQHYWLESLIVDGYDQDIREVVGSKRRKTAKDIAELKEFKEIIALFNEMDEYKVSILPFDTGSTLLCSHQYVRRTEE